MKLSPSTAFSILRSNREHRTAAEMRFSVRAVTKSGAPARFLDNKHNTARTREEAESILKRISELNPGREWIIVPL